MPTIILGEIRSKSLPDTRSKHAIGVFVPVESIPGVSRLVGCKVRIIFNIVVESRVITQENEIPK